VNFWENRAALMRLSTLLGIRQIIIPSGVAEPATQKYSLLFIYDYYYFILFLLQSSVGYTIRNNCIIVYKKASNKKWTIPYF